MLVNIFMFYQYIIFIHQDAKISDIYLRISGKGRNYFIPEDNEISIRLLEHEYIEGEINNNRILANKLDIYDSKQKQEFVGKLISFFKFLTAKSLEAGKSYYGNIYGQICDLNYKRMCNYRGHQLDNFLTSIKDTMKKEK